MSQLLEKIIEAKEVLGNKQAEMIAEGLPLEEWNPEKGSAKSIFNPNDNTPSMIWEKKNYYFKDFSTGRTFGIIDFFMKKYNESYVKAVKRLFDVTGIEYSNDIFGFSQTPDYKDHFKNYHYPAEEPPIEGDALAYMGRRGISKATMDYLNLGCDENYNIAYHFYDLSGRVVTVKYRPSHAIHQGEAKYFYQRNADSCPILYNINKIDITKPLLITEGMNDCLSCIEAGYTNVVSIPSGAGDDNWVFFNYEFLDQFEEIILWFDNDEAGREGIKKCAPRLGEYRVKLVKPDEEDEQGVFDFYRNLSKSGTAEIRKTDANNILLARGASRVLALIGQAEEIPVENLVDLMSAEEFDIEKTNYIPSGINDLDRQIYGFIDGSLNIWTAYSGCGRVCRCVQKCAQRMCLTAGNS